MTDKTEKRIIGLIAAATLFFIGWMFKLILEC